MHLGTFIARDDIRFPRLTSADAIRRRICSGARPMENVHSPPLPAEGLSTRDIRADEISDNAILIRIQNLDAYLLVAADDVPLAGRSLASGAVTADRVASFTSETNSGVGKIEDLQPFDRVSPRHDLNARLELT